jgi:probable HAF family extracellular repeat protein
VKSSFKRSFKTWQWVIVCVFAVSIVGFVSSLRSEAVTPAYTITDLGTLNGTPNQSHGYGINNCGTTVGDSILGGPPIVHPFYKKGATMTDVGSLGGDGTAYSLNAQGYTVGYSTGSNVQRAILWHDDDNDGVSDPGELQNFLPGGAAGVAYEINDNNRVVGTVDSSGGSSLSESAFVWDATNGLQILSGVSGITPTRALGINNAGTIAGWAVVSFPPFAPVHAFVLKNSTYIDLGTLDNTTLSLFSFASRISEDGHVVGYSQTPSPNITVPIHPFLWFDANSNNTSDVGEMKDLGTLSGTNAYAYDINATGYVVGTSEVTGGGTHAYVWHDDNANGLNDPGEMKDLNGQFSDATWTAVVEARSINDGGQIVGWGTKSNGETHAFLLTPIGFTPPACPGGTPSPSPTPTPATTSLISIQGNGTFGGTATLSATLYSNDMPVFGKTISFTLNSTAVCGGGTGVTCPATDASGIATLAGVSLAGINAGSYPGAVGASFAGDSNYAATSQSGTLTVSKGSQTITVNTHAPANAAYNSQFTVAATASSGLAVTYSSSGVCTNTGATFTMTAGAGTCNVIFNQTGSSNYNPAGQITEAVTAQKATATITLSNLTQVFDGTPKFATASTTPTGLTVNITYSQNGNPVSSPTTLGAYAVSAVISDANYQGNATGTLNIVEPAPVILLETGTNNAAAVDAVTFVRGPFSVTDNFNFSGDHLTRIIIFTMPLAGPDQTLAVRAGLTDLPIESVGNVTGVPGLNASYIVVKLPQGLSPGDLSLSVTLRGITSNSAILKISP